MGVPSPYRLPPGVAGGAQQTANQACGVVMVEVLTVSEELRGTRRRERFCPVEAGYSAHGAEALLPVVEHRSHGGSSRQWCGSTHSVRRVSPGPGMVSPLTSRQAGVGGNGASIDWQAEPTPYLDRWRMSCHWVGAWLTALACSRSRRRHAPRGIMTGWVRKMSPGNRPFMSRT